MYILLTLSVLMAITHAYLDSVLQKKGNVTYNHNIRTFWYSVAAVIIIVALYLVYDYVWWKWILFSTLAVIDTRVGFFDIALNLFMKRKALGRSPDTTSVIDKWEGKWENPIRIAGLIGFIAIIITIILYPNILM